MAIPDYQALMLPVLKLSAQGEIRVPQAAAAVAAQLGISSDEQEEMLPSGGRLLHNRIHWAKFYLQKAGLIESPRRGIFNATPAGFELLAKEPQTISNDTLKKFPSFVEFYRGSNSADPAKAKAEAKPLVQSEATPEEQIESAQIVIHSALRSDILQRILDNTPTFFERVIVDLLVGMGYGGTHESAALRLGKSGDNGVDGVIDEDRLGLDRIYVQAKRYASHNTVQRSDIQAFVGSLVGFGASKGVFVTTSSFTSGAHDYVRHLPQRVVLIDGERLTDLMIEHNVGVRVSRVVPIKRVDEDFFSDED